MGLIRKYYDRSGDRAYALAADEVVASNCKKLLDAGCGPGSPHLLKRLKEHPKVFCGVEMHPKQIEEARKHGIDVKSFDLNGAWPYEPNSFDLIHSTQVILRILEPGGKPILTSENLTSFLNLSAMGMGYTPFSLQNTCGWYVGNPFGLHDNEDALASEGILNEMSSPHFSGMTGHIRVLSAYQAQQIIGFSDIEVRSVGLMPLPEFLGVPLEKYMPRRGHWLMMKGSKPR